MKRFLIITLIAWTPLSLFGCTESSKIDTPIETKNLETKGQQIEQTQEGYTSILQWNEQITGEHFKTSILNVGLDGNQLNFEMKVWVSPFLEEKMRNTKEPFYFNFADIEGSDNLYEALAKLPLFTEGNLDELKFDDYYLITQRVTVKDDLSNTILEDLLLPENYELQIVNTHKQIVAVVLGLDLELIY